jgi:hypothetical protein
MVPVPTFEKLWFRFLLLKSYGSGSSSIQCCGAVTIYYGSGSGSGSDF